MARPRKKASTSGSTRESVGSGRKSGKAGRESLASRSPVEEGSSVEAEESGVASCGRSVGSSQEKKKRKRTPYVDLTMRKAR